MAYAALAKGRAPWLTARHVFFNNLRARDLRDAADVVISVNFTSMLDTGCSMLDRYSVPDRDACLSLSSIQYPGSSICPFSNPEPRTEDVIIEGTSDKIKQP
jgi:hypothetical protein